MIYLYGGTAAYGANQACMALSPALSRIARAVAARDRAEDGLRQARRDLERAIVTAYQAGESYSAIGRVVGITRQRVAQIVEGA